MHAFQSLETAPSVVSDSSLPCTRLRHSCVSCAMSKIKCPKQRPACSKCKARGIECQYFFAKRPGRSRENSVGHSYSCTSENNINSSKRSNPIPASISSSSNSNPTPDSNTDKGYLIRGHSRDKNTNDMHGISHQGTGASTNDNVPPAGLPSGFPWAEFLDTPSNLSISAPRMSNDSLGLYSSDVFSMLGDSSMVAKRPEFDLNVDDMDFVMTDAYHETPLTLDSNSATHRSDDIGLRLMPEDSINSDLSVSVCTDLMGKSFAISFSPRSGFQPSSAANSGVTRATTSNQNNGSSCCCVAQGLDLLKTLSPAQSFFIDKDLAALHSPAIALTVLVENKHNMDAVRSMLSCSSCIGDGFLLTIISMIVLKILERYANAAQTQLCGLGADNRVEEADIVPKLANSIILSSKEHSMKAATYNIPPDDDESSGRVAPAQLILSEFQRMQILVNQLSLKLDNRPSRERGDDKLAQMDNTDYLRKSLGSLSAAIISRLRQV